MPLGNLVGHSLRPDTKTLKKNSGLAGYRGIARDDRGRWLGGFVGSLGVVTMSCLTTELWAIHAGMTLAKNFNLNKVIIEKNSNEA
ncbi:hypothetical protein KY290_005228 [Solanum tuberosum]|uniref:RNase H type-1 domain-containing protein n=1 Tax=Solanum tuberosum TaxID=4113 RepID=A0ABQ7WEX2_SOLTU|nr:hypothetical protein KY289_005620 [Solanum tuberosum]KAH0778801.1 hypothetical protein KY290_005228 [Solanum tuberosum]